MIINPDALKIIDTNYTVDRIRISKKIDKIMSFSKIVYIFAPIGWGKTITAANYVNDFFTRVIWVKFEKNDNDYEVLKSISNIKKSVTDNLKRVIVFDNFERINNNLIFKALVNLIEDMPNNCKFIFLSRNKVPVYFSHFIANGELKVITKEDLKFDAQEVREYCFNSKIDINDDNIEKLIINTYGWPSCINIAFLYLKMGEYSNLNEMFKNNDYLTYFFEENIWPKIDYETQKFLIAISYFKDIELELCLEMIKNDNCKDILDEFLIIQTDKTYKFNPIFLNFLKSKYNEFNQKDILEFHKRAASWLEKHERYLEAAHVYYISKDFENEIKNLEKFCKSNNIIQFFNVEKYIRELPDFKIEKNATLCTVMAFIEVIVYRPKQAKKWYEKLLNIRKELLMLYDYRDCDINRNSDNILNNSKAKILNKYECKKFCINKNQSNILSESKAELLCKDNDKEHKNILNEENNLNCNDINKFEGNTLHKINSNHQETKNSKVINIKEDNFYIESSLNKIELKNQLEDIEKKIFYVYMSLPQISNEEIMDKFNQLYKENKDINKILDNLSITGNNPSLLRGLRDLSNIYVDYERFLNDNNKLNVTDGSEGILGLVNITSAEVDYERDDIEVALIKLTGEIAKYKIDGNIDILFVSYIIFARCMCVNGYINEAKITISNIRTLIEEKNALYLMKNLESYDIKFNLLIGNVDEAKKWIANPSNYGEMNYNFLGMYQYMVRARVFILNKEYKKANYFLENLYKLNFKYNQTLNMAECCILQAIALNMDDQEALALEKIEEALKIGLQFKYIRVFADEGKPCYEILSKYEKLNKLSKSIDKGYLKKILRRTKEFGELYPKYLDNDKLLKTNLTKSELQVLDLLNKGMSNIEISEHLNVTKDTIKFHTKNIYSKLNVKNRIKAVQVAKNIGII
ncbi:LuxR C-terminal-related transcriptional regulator [Clostridium weizhouense]|uniref:LuxR C-terminal-related transcriptional regulator n=1 Tax=Clostridium weizhouense TaxID=2859781 RepID=A0ABS7ANR9_9CLOT|nr:LuxR C-terminal-related transcriptional regulator [Clostridium weizhouense]MBW6410315.1 LuxR C-terminal-related transcriptional regulator [Clostridium weizhouense]